MEAKHTIFVQKNAKNSLNLGPNSMHVLRRKECSFLRTRSYSMGKKRKKLKGRVDKVIKPVFPTASPTQKPHF